jgi:sterol desaturase/sphingolipid hydroxylase (fatty acid hydroxylase superfamily)
VWDHLFGTYVDPDTVEDPITFGIPETVHPVWLFLGI